MRTQEEAEAWANQHGAALKVNFAEGVASLQVGAFVVYTNAGASLEQILPELVADLERQMGERLTQPGPVSADLLRQSK
jgi:hypothetical protein